MAFWRLNQTAVPICLDDFRLRRLCRIRALLAGRFLALCVALAVPFGLTITIGLAFAVLTFLFFAPRFDFALRLAQQTQVVFCVLLEILGCDPVAG